MPFFARAGYSVIALSLRGHGGSDGRAGLRWHAIADYVADLAGVVVGLRPAPILVGHSMGGLVVQKYLERHPAAAAVLLASVPTSGAMATALRVLARHPVQFAKINLRLSLYPVVETPALAHEYLFSPTTPADLVAAVQPRLQEESYRAFLDMMTRLPRPERVRTPLRVLGAAEDGIFTPGEVARTARAYGTTATIYPQMGHNMMLEPGWERVAGDIVAWLDELAV
jgi:pimeloyl-ACP methyl ester carboxylesterase